MKLQVRSARLLAVIMATWFSAPAKAQFENLDFESAMVPDVEWGGDVPMSEGMPSWSGGFEGSLQTEILHNNSTLGSSSLAIIGPWGWSSSVLGGSYSALLIGGADGTSSWIEQTALVPADAKSIQIKVRQGYIFDFGIWLDEVGISMAGTNIPMFKIQATENYSVCAGDITPFAGNLAKLVIRADTWDPWSPYGLNPTYIDDIEFSADLPPLAPTNLVLSNARVSENQPVGTVVGRLSTADPNAGDVFTYSLVAGSGATDNGWFSIGGSNLFTAAIFNYEIRSNYSIRVRSSDQAGLSTQMVFAITILNVDELPPAFSEPPIPSNGNMVIRWGSITNHTYTVHYSTNLLAGFMVLQSNISGTPPINIHTDSVTTATQKYWKVTTDP